MEEPITVRFSVGDGQRPTMAQVSQALGDAALAVRVDRGIYEVDFETGGGDEADALWLAICEIGASFPGAVIEE